MSLLIDGKEISSFHFCGIFGSGMSAIAQMLAWDGCRVSGSDRSLDDPACARMKTLLTDAGCRIKPQDGSGVGADLGVLVVSTAIETDNPDIVAARRHGVPILHRSDILAALVERSTSVAVAGTSGKSTVTALTFELLYRCGKSPSLIAGANVSFLVDKGYVGNAFRGDGGILVIEADESDGTLVKYRPAISIFLNVSKDHKPVEETDGLFHTLAARSKLTIVNLDDPRCAAIPHQQSFGLSPQANVHPDHIETLAPRVSAMIGGTLYRFPQIGSHNLSNLLAALSACLQLGCTHTELSAAAAAYCGLKRRFEITGNTHGVTVIDDYAHNPEKISAAIMAAQTFAKRVFAIFQPHGYGPTRFMRQELIDTFAAKLRAADRLYLLPIYFAGGSAQKDISSDEIAAEIRGKNAHVIAPADRTALIQIMISELKPGDVVLVMGARDPSLPAFCGEILQAIQITVLP